MLNKESVRTLTVAFVLCLVCSILVAGVAVGLKPIQDKNKVLDRNKNVLEAAGLYQPSMSASEVTSTFESFQVKLVDLATGKYATEQQLSEAGITDVNSYDQYAAAKIPAQSISLAGNDPAKIQRQAKFAKVYVLEKNGKLEQVILPINGYGLWGILYGFIALGSDADTIKGLTFYSQKETPGLGGEVENPKWKAQWPGKKAYAADGKVGVEVVKGKAQNDEQIDGLSGATLTTRGVNNLVQFWLGDRGFESFLKNLKKGEA
ncbi:Na(+)-translocating NADH-quinone reductase subunit C [BD1-7 clade bacterium]|uniref:Na(+)-translocating NADH-quinone reductase subunit C n=1 Tax=BD1-7 clade bacterium TaxID=2029982 RepID=A0A5S9NTY1_9GAMM|nr:Na(+)-translocating NADH-quinone reductase subunit C [BD1-7 clade bacterium]CAA0094168.1 Na(+)-translocating NADH-quinone reductase subunit C [BD1-7 clade bacterium]CAA0097349.1 Na(+)-translocating NADH-quinone reductase subunit C [BD1-7 clade bacterium]CAA0122688.1 Na(+)-translocating NADH-quinone reductase subunit C [BD1-7 clade bacterium]